MQSNTRDYTVLEGANLADLVLRICEEEGETVDTDLVDALRKRDVLVPLGTFNCLHARQALRQAAKAVYGQTGAETKMAAPTAKALEMVPVRVPAEAPVSVG